MEPVSRAGMRSVQVRSHGQARRRRPEGSPRLDLLTGTTGFRLVLEDGPRAGLPIAIEDTAQRSTCPSCPMGSETQLAPMP